MSQILMIALILIKTFNKINLNSTKMISISMNSQIICVNFYLYFLNLPIQTLTNNIWPKYNKSFKTINMF